MVHVTRRQALGVMGEALGANTEANPQGRCAWTRAWPLHSASSALGDARGGERQGCTLADVSSTLNSFPSRD